MGMTNASMDAQTRGTPGTAGETPVDGFAPDIVIKTQDNTLKSVRPADATWDHCNIRNDYKNTQEG